MKKFALLRGEDYKLEGKNGLTNSLRKKKMQNDISTSKSLSLYWYSLCKLQNYTGAK